MAKKQRAAKENGIDQAIEMKSNKDNGKAISMAASMAAKNGRKWRQAAAKSKAAGGGGVKAKA
jgi:hypothetical protein